MNISQENLNPDSLFRPRTESKLEDVVNANRTVLTELGDQQALDSFDAELLELDVWYEREVKLVSEDYAKREELNHLYEAKVRELCK